MTMLPLDTHATVTGVANTAIVKVLTQEEFACSEFDPEYCLIWTSSFEETQSHRNSAGRICSGVTRAEQGRIVVCDIRTPGVIAPGDVIRLVEGSSRVRVLYRRGSNSNTLLATERCNSFCLMCSQPPRQKDDSWLVNDMLATISLVDRTEKQLGISGGEPTLLGDGLATILFQAKKYLPSTGLHILSNGRKFSDKTFAQVMCAVHHPEICWGIPLYSSIPETHDYIVQSKGAWHETVAGIYNLARHNASIELRVVVQKANFEHLADLAYYIFRNMTFVRHVAFMALEPIGFARRNKEKVWIDPAQCGEVLTDAVYFLANRGIAVSLYNYPLCTLPKILWPYCAQSISDWKNCFLPECDRCDVREKCGGFFRWIDKHWLSESFGPITAALQNDEPVDREMA